VLQFGGLFLNRAGDFFVAMADADRNDAAEEIEILFSFAVVDVRAFGVIDDQRLVVIVRDAGKEKFLVLVDDVLCLVFSCEWL
jgi:hypothetical protein